MERTEFKIDSISPSLKKAAFVAAAISVESVKSDLAEHLIPTCCRPEVEQQNNALHANTFNILLKLNRSQLPIQRPRLSRFLRSGFRSPYNVASAPQKLPPESAGCYV
ncbi:hypothetical protein GWI33_005513 [Rhynchophorus ferrugineus]|uniref:Uncharacterized protein n=1 Tax=Rhynchophorus ferrugineus TaxID=354439 RepID=A0A834IGH8_RHYFE|nr:hypothetical protein GWI33_005513 [Rhynchophorus ferrugineus]